MKFNACLFALAAIVCFVSADKADKKEGLVAASYGAPAPQSYAAPSHAASSYAPPPCPKNYLFSCQPNLAPVPCASGGYAGAYSEHVPQYALPQYALPNYHGIPQY